MLGVAEQAETNVNDLFLSLSLSDFTYRTPTDEDGAAVHELIASCDPLDENSRYCNLLQCSHFQDTCLLAEQDGEIVAFVSGYKLPDRPDTLFIWQIAVSQQVRGQGLATKLLAALLQLHADSVSHLHTTITLSNKASWRAFEKLADYLKAPMSSEVFFDEKRNFDNEQPTEYLVEIGPFTLSYAQ